MLYGFIFALFERFAALFVIARHLQTPCVKKVDFLEKSGLFCIGAQ